MAPPAPKGKAAKETKAAGKTLGVKRKAPPPREKPEEMRQEDWDLDVLRRRLDTQSRAGRRVKQNERKRLGTAAPLTARKIAAMNKTVAALNQAFALGGSQESSATLRCKVGGSPSNSSFFADSAAATPRTRFSPEYGDSQHHGGFDPNVIFPSCGLDLNHPVDLNSPAMRRDPAVQTAAGRSLSFDAGASHVIDGMTPDAPELMQETAHIMDDIINDNARAEDDDDGFDEDEEYYEDDAEDDDEVEEEGVVTNAVVGEQAAKKKKGSRGTIWTTKEDECMVESWKAITTGEITGTNQSSTAYWSRIKDEFDERRFTKDFYKVSMVRGQGAIEHRWRIVQRLVNKFHGCHENIVDRKESGKGPADQVMDALVLYKSINKEKDFKLMHCYKLLQSCEKWKAHRRTLNKNGRADLNADPQNSEGRPIGNKKAKAALAAAAKTDRVQSSIDKVLADVCSNSSLRREENNARWATLMQKADVKINLEQKKAAVKKRSQDFMILTADVSNLDPLARAAHNMYRAAILQELGLVPPENGAENGGNHGAETGHGADGQVDDDPDMIADDPDMTQPGYGYVPQPGDNI